ncbi:hypothetical protein H5410_021197 [Solanum commersonii]|uniref:Uncharacterized protein n=1 Tax=Solanum commersonii TaxID=4109 RepID=A0A9J5ZEG5_SOLCO|nr:hypothetical protein H5410_021197 [Solanum commersonii]
MAKNLKIEILHFPSLLNFTNSHQVFWLVDLCSDACFDFVIGGCGLNLKKWIKNGHVGPFGELGRARRTTRRFA